MQGEFKEKNKIEQRNKLKILFIYISQISILLISAYLVIMYTPLITQHLVDLNIVETLSKWLNK